MTSDGANKKDRGPITETQVLVYCFTPLNGDDDWDATKVAIVSSVQVAP